MALGTEIQTKAWKSFKKNLNKNHDVFLSQDSFNSGWAMCYEEYFYRKEENQKQYFPEIGQALFGQPSKQFEVSNIMNCCLLKISNEMERVFENLRQKEYYSPFGNNGSNFSCDIFDVHSYSWDEEFEQPYNFRHHKSGIEISWYKWFSRGASSNIYITPNMAEEILNDCLPAIQEIDDGCISFVEEEKYAR